MQLQHVMTGRPASRKRSVEQFAGLAVHESDVKACKPGPYRLLEIFTWTGELSKVAGSAPDWEVWQPVTLPTWDLLQSQDREAAWEYIKHVDPDVLWVAWPCGPWSVMQYINMRTPAQRRPLHFKIPTAGFNETGTRDTVSPALYTFPSGFHFDFGIS
jgi:hypothetical protein